MECQPEPDRTDGSFTQTSSEEWSTEIRTALYGSHPRHYLIARLVGFRDCATNLAADTGGLR